MLACCNPVPTLVKQYVNEIHMLIMQAKELALTTNKVTTTTNTKKHHILSGNMLIFTPNHFIQLLKQVSQFETPTVHNIGFFEPLNSNRVDCFHIYFLSLFGF